MLVLSITLYCIDKAYQSRSWHIENNKISIAFIGDSHIEQAIDDSKKSGILTFAQSGDAYLYTFCKLKKLIKDNPTIDTFILGIDYHNVDLTSEEWYSNRGYLNFKFPQVFPFMQATDCKILFRSNPIAFLKALPNLFSINDYLSNKTYIKNYGSHIGNDSVINAEKMAYNSHYLHKKSNLQFGYLDKIIALCKTENKVLIGLSTPLHSSVNRDSILNDMIENYLNRNSIKYMNFRDFVLDNSCFSDKFHLNNKGADIFTAYILNYLKSKK